MSAAVPICRDGVPVTTPVSQDLQTARRSARIARTGPPALSMAPCSRWVFGRRVGTRRMCRATSQLIVVVAQLLRNLRRKKGLHILQPTCNCNGNFPDREDPANTTSATAIHRTRAANSSPRRGAAFRRMQSCRRSPRDRRTAPLLMPNDGGPPHRLPRTLGLERLHGPKGGT